MEEDKRNVLLFFIISVLIIVGYPYLLGKKDVAQVTPEISVQQISTADQKLHDIMPEHHPLVTQQYKEEWLTIDSNRLSGTISSKGGRINNIILKNYKETLEEGSKNVSIFENPNEFFAETGWTSEDSAVIVPNSETCWEVGSNKVLTEKTPITMTWDNQHGLLFERIISIDDNFVLTIENKVRNYSDKSFVLHSYNKIVRHLPEISDVLAFYEGPLGYFNEHLEEIKYKDIKDKIALNYETKGGWFGITDKYWLVSFIPNQSEIQRVSYKYANDIYSIENNCGTSLISPYSGTSKKCHLFVGAKEINTLDMYEERLGVKHFDLALDFGYMYILTKPCLYLLAYTKDLVGNMGIGIIIITILLKLLLFPLATKSYRSMNKIREIQPKIQALQKQYGEDKIKLGQAVSDLYKKEKVSPMGGCVPMLLQWPILIALYKVLYISIEMRQAPFFGWIHDLSQPDPLSLFNLFGLIPVALPGFLQIGIWPLLMGLTMWWQQKLSPTSGDPTQEKMLLLMPLLFTFMFAQMPAGLIIYWTISNILNIGQQYSIMKIDQKEKANQIAAKKGKQKNSEKA